MNKILSVYKKILMVCGLVSVLFIFNACSSENDTIKQLALEKCNSYLDNLKNQKGLTLNFKEVLSTEITEIKPNPHLKSNPDLKLAVCKIKTDTKEFEKDVYLKKVNGKWEASKITT